MSLSEIAIRLVTVKALSGRTLAGGAVSDSEVSAIDVAAAEHKRPFIAVYTDDGESQGVGRDILTGNGSFSLAIEIGVTSKMRYRLDSGEDELVDALVPTDALMEMTLNLIARQIAIALADPTNEWSDLWRRFVTKVGRVRKRRGASADKLLRFAGRQMEIEVHPLADPPFGKAPAGVWADLLAKIEQDADPDFRKLAVPIRRAIVGDPPEPSWRIDQSQMALSGDEATAMLITPAEGLGDDDVALAGVVLAEGGGG
ncbi:hypothetical protein [Bosea sp. ANAM02]|uniref:hypothetical protein n=1 Tax=Bosea sp. ANAM02 TaxID=2020412 RepID=UPI00140F0C73|nr:hypothetical protein [Bosea sp. ANAM02]BCB18055.1 hypothetical protein OCUBac02_09490 [Bosea sp. ANAM02]